MKKLSRLISVLVAAVLMLTMVSASASTSTTYEVMDDAIYIASTNVPEEATAFALDKLSQFSVTMLTSLGFTEDEAKDLKVSQGICANIMDNNSDDLAIYYYPVLSGNRVLAMITLYWYNDQYNFQFGRSSMAEALNDIETSQSDPARIYVSSNAYYCVTNSGVTVLDTLANANESEVNSEILVLSGCSDSVDAISACINTINISGDFLYRVGEQTDEVVTSVTRAMCEVSIVQSETLSDSTGNHGTCWAAASASVIDYYVNGKSVPMFAASIYEYLLDDRLEKTGGYTTTFSDMKTYIQTITGRTMKIIGSMLTCSQILTTLETKDTPCCTLWSDTGDGVAHAMVLCGCWYATDDPSDSSSYILFFMDPNVEEYYVLLSYSSYMTYLVGDSPNYWSQSMITA